MATLNQIPQRKKPGVTEELRSRLVARKAKGPPEPGLDIFIDEIDVVTSALGSHVTGKSAANAARTAMDDLVDATDAKVDTWLRHIESYLSVEGLDRRSPNAEASRALYAAAFPDGLGPIDDYVTDQNVYCRAALTALRSPEHQSTVDAIGLPAGWIDQFDAAISASEDAMNQLIAARGDKSAHVGLGRDAELAWVDLMVRLRRYIASRAKRGDTAKQVENRQLLEPLLVVLQKLDMEAAARATRKKEKAQGADATKDADSAAKPEDPQVSGDAHPAKPPTTSTSTPPSTEPVVSPDAHPAKEPAVSADAHPAQTA